MGLSAEQFVKAMISAGLSSTDEIKSFWETLPAGQRPKDGESFAAALVEREKLTRFQAEALLSGNPTPLVLGDYVLLAKIGTGGMGQVFQAQHRHMKRLVAVKLLPSALTRDEEAIKRFQREVEAAARLTHPNIVQAYDASVQRGVWYLVMEYVAGHDLANLVRTQPLAVDLAIDYVRQAARGLAYAHENGVVHRDIKPANLLLNRKGTIKILDMGLARFDDAVAAKDGLTQSGQLMGTIDFMAPEQAFDTHQADARADIYSLGCTLYRLITGRNLYEADSMVQKLMAHQHMPIPALGEYCSQAPPELNSIFQKMVAKQPGERYQTVAEAERALASLSMHSDPSPMAHPSASRSPEPAPTVAVTALVQPNSTCELAPTVNLNHPLQGTDPVSERSIQLAREQTPQPAETTAQTRRQPVAVIAAKLFGLLLVTLGIWAYFHKPDVAKINVPPDGSTAIASQQDANPVANKGWHGWPADAPRPAIAPFTEAEARQYQVAWATYLKVDREYTNSIGMKFVLIPPGEFQMGSTPKEIDDALAFTGGDKFWQDFVKSEHPRHRVILTHPIYLGVHEVTQAEFGNVMQKNPSHFATSGAGKDLVAGLNTANHPVEMVSWNDAAEFCAKLSAKESRTACYSRTGETVTILAGNGYLLPTESQWEFACRAGTSTKFWIGSKDEDLARAGWFKLTAGSRTHQVGELQANPLGLCDTHGNVWEWVQDGFEPTYYKQFQDEPALNPRGANTDGSERVFRGGCVGDFAPRCRSADRSSFGPSVCLNYVGFRIALPVKSAISPAPPTVAQTAGQDWPAGSPQPALSPFTPLQARQHQTAWAEYLNVDREYTNNLGMKFVLIPPGDFLQGSSNEAISKALAVADQDKVWQEFIHSEGPQHQVILTQPFYLAVHEVTQAQYARVMGSNPAYFAPQGGGQSTVAGLDTATFPVEGVSWSDAAEFCAKLSQQERLNANYFRAGDAVTPLKGNGYRLPTTAEWEFASRAGTNHQYSTGSDERDLQKAAWIISNAGGRTHAVGELLPNPFGLCDMHGNVWEWVQDRWDPNYYQRFQAQPAINPQGPSVNVQRHELRGGAWDAGAPFVRNSSRLAHNDTDTRNYIGFRIALSVEAVRAAKSKEATQPVPGLMFDDRTDAVDLSAVTYNGSHDLTFEGWFKTLEFEHCEFAKFEPDGPVIFAMPKGEKGEIGANWKDKDGKDVYAIAIDKLRVGELQHIALVYREQKMLLFVDGTPIAESEVSIQPGVIRKLKITNAQMELHGLRVSRTCRYAEPFQPKPQLATDAETLANYTCTEGKGELLIDSSIHQRHGKISGAKWLPMN